MADERDFELLDDYLTNRMSGGDRSAFEQKLQADPDLQHEYALQKRLIGGIKDARVAELKSMLNKVPVPANGPGNSLATKVVLGAVISVMIIAAGYLYFKADESTVATPAVLESQQEQPIEAPIAAEPDKTNIVEPEAEQPAAIQQKVEADKNQTSAGTEHSKPSLAGKPSPLAAPGAPSGAPAKGPVLDVFEPADEETRASDGNTANGNVNGAPSGKSTLLVETDRDNRRYGFHYQFQEGKLFLFGPFEKDLYEIMEFFANEKRTVFLFYKDRYYLLEEANSQVRPLEPITDPALLKKLKEYRSSK